MTDKRTFRQANERIAQLAAHPAIVEQVDSIRSGTARMNRLHVDTLADIRKAVELTQADVAQVLGVEQAAVSKIERRKDLLLSTLREYLAATGAERPRIVVERNGVEVSLDLDGFAGRTP